MFNFFKNVKKYKELEKRVRDLEIHIQLTSKDINIQLLTESYLKTLKKNRAKLEEVLERIDISLPKEPLEKSEQNKKIKQFIKEVGTAPYDPQ